MSDMAKKSAIYQPNEYTIRKGGKAFGIFGVIMLIIWSLINLYPLFWMITFSLKDNQQIQKTHRFLLPKGLPNEWHWENYKALDYSSLLTYFKNSVIVTALAILISMVAAMMASYAIMRIQWKASKAVNRMFLLGITIPVQASLVPVYMICRYFDWLDTRWSLIIPYAAFALAMSILIANSFIVGIPKDLDEAAYIDGCSRYGVFFRIIVPLMLPSVSTIAIYSFLQCWNELMFASVFVSSSEYRTLPVGVQSYTGTFTVKWGPIGAVITIATIPMVITYVLLSRKIQESFIAGAIKG